jgi:hypothetical protein
MRAQGGHYALKLKGNNGPLHARASSLEDRHANGVSRVFSAANCGELGLSAQPNGARILHIAFCLTASLVSAPW